MKWTVEQRELKVAVGPPIPISVLVHDDGTEVELREAKGGWHIYLRKSDRTLRFMVAREYPPNPSPESISLKELGPICCAALDSRYGDAVMDSSSRQSVAELLKDAMRNVWRLPDAPKVKVTSVIFATPDFMPFSD